MGRGVGTVDLTKYSRSGRFAASLGVAILLATAVVAPYSRALAGTSGTPLVEVTCNAAVTHVGPFDLVCRGSASGFVQVTASTTACALAGSAQSSCELRFWVKGRGATPSEVISFIGGGVSQEGPMSATTSTGSGGTTGPTSTTSSTGAAGSAGATGSSATSITGASPVSETPTLVFHQITWTYSIHVPGHVTRVLTLRVGVQHGHALSDPTFGVQDSKNIADGAAQQVAVE